MVQESASLDLDVFSAALARLPSGVPGAPDLLVPAGAEVLWTPRPPLRTRRALRLPVGSQQMTVWHVSDMKLGRRVLSARSKPGPEQPTSPPALSTAFEPPPLRWIRRHLGLLAAMAGRHPNYGGPWMLDEPRLASARQLLMGPFRPAVVDELDTLIERTCREVLDQHVRLDPRIVDVAGYSNDVLFRLMALLLGATPGTAPELAVMFRRWMHRFNESPSLAALHGQPEIYRRLWHMIERHDGSPGLLGDVRAAWRRKDTLGGDRPATRADYVALVWALIAAGTDTPATVATQAVWFAVLERSFPSLTTRSGASRAVTEGLRYYPPFTKPLMRVVTEVELGSEASAKPGEWVELHLPAMNRDPAFFRDPDRYDPQRTDAAAARTFGGGAHRCIGNHYGTRVGEHIVVTLASRFPGLTPIAGYAYRRQGGLLHRIEELPLDTRRSTIS